MSQSEGPGALFTGWVGFLLSQLGWASTSMFREALAPLGLRPPHWAILNVLDHRHGVLSQQALGETINVDASTMVAVVDDLEREGLVERRRDPADRRRYSITLTAKGRRTLAKARKIADANDARLLEPLSEAERAELRELLLRLASAGHLPRTPHPSVAPVSRPPEDGELETAEPGPSRP